MGNLITYNESFYWIDENINRGKEIEELTQAVAYARAYGDGVYQSSDLYDEQIPSGKMLLFLMSHSFDHDAFQEKYPWISQSQYQALTNLIFLFQTTPAKSKNLENLNSEFPNQNNAWIGLQIHCSQFLVHSINSWNEFHRLYVSTFSFNVQCERYAYFIFFYKPYLKIQAGAIKRLISRKQTDTFINRFDTPKFPYDKNHVHFNDKNNSALNIDGTWRHNNCQIPMKVRNILSEWGFILPGGCYEYFEF